MRQKHFNFAALLVGANAITGVPNGGNVLTLDTPTPFQIFQRSGSVADILLSGRVGIGTHTIEGRFNAGSWTVIQSNALSTFSGTLTNQGQGQGLVEVRWQDIPANIASSVNVGIGEVFVIAGQSNASGKGFNNQPSTNSTLFGGLFGNDYGWHVLTDPTDSAVNQVDSISLDTSLGGSVWPILASFVMTNQSVPVAFIPCSLGGSFISSWLPSGSNTNRASLYGSMIWRSKYAISGGVRAVLWWQGEADFGSTNYFTRFTNLTFNVNSDLGIKTMPCKLEHNSGSSDPNQALVNDAIGQAWTNDVNTLPGPDLSVIETQPEDAAHLRTDAKLQTAANLWWGAIQTAFGW